MNAYWVAWTLLPLAGRIIVVVAAVVIAVYGFAFLANLGQLLRFEDEEQSSNVAKAARTAGTIPPHPAPPDREQDPLHPQPRAAQPILFSDGYRLELADIHKAGLSPLIDVNGRIVALMDLSKPQKGSVSVEDWCGASHGARIS